jgi:hypothetical protein
LEILETQCGITQIVMGFVTVVLATAEIKIAQGSPATVAKFASFVAAEGGVGGWCGGRTMVGGGVGW